MTSDSSSDDTFPEKIFKNPNPAIIDIASVYKDGKKVIVSEKYWNSKGEEVDSLKEAKAE